MVRDVFTGSFTQQEPICDEAIEAAVRVLQSGRLHRYNTLDGEISETALLESEFANYLGVRYCLACASGGHAMHLALRALGIESGAPILTNAFTLAPVPGAIHAAGGKPVFVEITEDLVLDLNDLERKIETSGARVLLISHMRGHLVDMEALMALLQSHGVALVEDCAHTMGAAWGSRKSGTFGAAACFSTQTYKHINSGEGGFITSDDPLLMARAVILSGSYMLYERHLAAPPSEVFDKIRLETPNCSGRMDNLRAAILRPQIAKLDRNVARWNERYRAVEDELKAASGIHLPDRPHEEYYVGSSIQFLIPGIVPGSARDLLSRCQERGVELKWFGEAEPIGFTSRHQSWQYLDMQQLSKTDRILDGLFDMRLPLTFSINDCRLIGRIIVESLAETQALQATRDGR